MPNPLLKSAATNRKVSVRPPLGFVPARDVQRACFSEHAPVWMDGRDELRTPNQIKGLKYEALVNEMLWNRYGDFYQASPWLVYWGKDHEKPPRLCQPDGLLFDIRGGRITIVEIKLYNSVMAWWQLLWKYSAVVRALFPMYELCYLEIVKFDDPLVVPPGTVLRVERIEDLKPSEYGILTWKPE